LLSERLMSFRVILQWLVQLSMNNHAHNFFVEKTSMRRRNPKFRPEKEGCCSKIPEFC
jgi:hypothetical protein